MLYWASLLNDWLPILSQEHGWQSEKPRCFVYDLRPERSYSFSYASVPTLILDFLFVYVTTCKMCYRCSHVQSIATRVSLYKYGHWLTSIFEASLNTIRTWHSLGLNCYCSIFYTSSLQYWLKQFVQLRLQSKIYYDSNWAQQAKLIDVFCVQSVTFGGRLKCTTRENKCSYLSAQ